MELTKLNNILVSIIYAAAIFLSATAFAADDQPAAQLKVSTFITAQDEAALLTTDEGRAQAVSILKGIGVTKVYLDTYRDGLITDPALLKTLRDYFRANGFEASAGITTTSGKGFGVASPTHRYFLCYNYPETRQAIRKVVETAASLFDELIVDDFFATECRCKECDALRGERTWEQYFRDTMVDVSREDIVGAAKKINPKMNVIIKYPQWYDRFQAMGYDPARQPGIFDMVWVGTETRDPKKENVMQYEAFVNFTWLASAGGEKTRGGWFDWINCYPEVYMEQAYQTVLAGAQEIVLFGYSPKEFTTDNLKRFTEKRPELFKIYEDLHGHQHAGIFAYKPPNSDPGSDTYIFDYMGMLGLPLVMSATFPENARSIFLSEHALADPDIAAKILAKLENGGTVIMTAGLLAGLKDNKEIMSAAGMEPGAIKRTPRRMTADFALEDGTSVKAPGYVTVTANMKTEGETLVPASANINGKIVPFITVSEGESGKVIVLNTNTYTASPVGSELTVSQPVLISNMPEAVAAALRNAALAPLGLRADMPTKVGLYLYENNYIAVENFNDTEAKVSLTIFPAQFGADVIGLSDTLSGELLHLDNNNPSGNKYDFTVAPRTLRLLRVVR